MAELHHMSHEHPLVFNQDTSSPSDTTYDCAGCAEKVVGSSYSCRECRFYLHTKCVEAPSEIHHPVHRDHPLLLLLPASEHEEREVDCRICNDQVKGFIYHCSSCEIYVDINCALLPDYTSAGKLIETLHVSHPHPLISLNPTGCFDCDACLSIVDDAWYACFDCRVFFHKKCLEQPSTINHPCHRTHQLFLVYNDPDDEFTKCNLCRISIQGFFYRCVPCKFYIHLGCAWPPPVIKHRSHPHHPFTLLLRPNDPFYCNACGDQGDNVSYICSTCNIQLHKDCVSLPRHIRHNLHPHPISHCFSICIDHHDFRTWDCRVCYKKVNIEHGSYYCSRPGCDFVIHVKCSFKNKSLYGVVEVENPDESNFLSDESTSSIIRIIKEIKVGDDVLATEIEHVSHEHNLIFSQEIKDNKYCNGCVLPILSSFYYCSHCDFFLHKACAELRRMCRIWLKSKPFTLFTDGIFSCFVCHHECSGFYYKLDVSGYYYYMCLRCASLPHGFTYQADEPHFLFYVGTCVGNCSACGKRKSRPIKYRCKDCAFVLHWDCATIPRTAWHKGDKHSLTLACQEYDDYPLRHYCDICEEERDPQQWFYHCETCDKAMHIKCVLGEYPFINARSSYTYEGHPHPLTFVRKIYYYPECVQCGEPCQDLALECAEQGCKYIVHWSCTKPALFWFKRN